MSAPFTQSQPGRLRIITADERLSRAANKTTVALFGPSGVGKTSAARTLPAAETLCIDLEAGMKSVQDWRGDSVPVRCFADALDIACLVGGPDPAAAPERLLLRGAPPHLAAAYPDLVRLVAGKSIVFVDSITDLTRQAMAWAKTRPEAFSEKTGKPDTRGAYGLLGARGDRAAQAPAARAGQDGGHGRDPGARHRRVRQGRAGSRRWRAARPRASCPASSTRWSPWPCSAARAPSGAAGATTRSAAPSAGWSAGPATASACPPRTAPAASPRPSRPTSAPCSARSTPTTTSQG